MRPIQVAQGSLINGTVRFYTKQRKFEITTLMNNGFTIDEHTEWLPLKEKDNHINYVHIDVANGKPVIQFLDFAEVNPKTGHVDQAVKVLEVELADINMLRPIAEAATRIVESYEP